jgi:hypothetical protein
MPRPPAGLRLGQIRMRSIDWDLVDQEKPSIATANRY